jgi:hypothetical protein
VRNYVLYAAVEMPAMLAWAIIAAFIVIIVLMYRVGVYVGRDQSQRDVLDAQERYYTTFIENRNTVPMEALNGDTERYIQSRMLPRGDGPRHSR